MCCRWTSATAPCTWAASPSDAAATLGDGPLVPGATVTVGAPGEDLRAVAPGTAGVLQVISGPDAGTAAWLAQGRRTIGRAGDADLALTDRLVSRRHAELTVTRDGVPVADARSGNDTLLDGAPVGSGVLWPKGAVLAVGDDLLTWTPLPPAGPAAVRAPDGRMDFDRAFAPAPRCRRPRWTCRSRPTSRAAKCSS